MSFHYIRSRFHFSWILCFWCFAFTDSLPTHCFSASLIYWFSASCFRWNTVIQWFIFSLNPWFGGSFFAEPWVQCFMHSLIDWRTFRGLIGSLMHRVMRLFIGWLIDFEGFIDSLVDCFIESVIHVLIYASFHWLNHSPILWLIHSFLHSCPSFIHSFLTSFIHSFLKFISFRRAWFPLCQFIGISTTIICSFGDTLHDFNMSEHCFCISKAFYRPLISIVKKRKKAIATNPYTEMPLLNTGKLDFEQVIIEELKLLSYMRPWRFELEVLKEQKQNQNGEAYLEIRL